MHKKEKISTIFLLLILVVSLSLLSALSSVLTSYPTSNDEQTNPPDRDSEEPISVLLFEVSPAVPKLFWRVSTADYYTGISWLKTTEDTVLAGPPSFQDINATQIFTVEIHTNLQEVQLPLPSPYATFANISVEPSQDLKFTVDALGSTFEVARTGETESARLAYKVSWRESEVDDSQVTLEDIPEEITSKYLQLPRIPPEVWDLADRLKDSSYTILDQVLADVQFLRTNFVYDIERFRALSKGIPHESAVSTYLALRKGICVDASTLLTVLLRMQRIPARTSFGYKPGIVKDGKLLYFTTGGHCVTEAYLQPYGWVQFDATPPLQENPLITSWPFKKQSPPGSTLLYQLSLTNRRSFTDTFRLRVHSKLQWNVSVSPSNSRTESLQTTDALLNVTIPNDAAIGDKDHVTITAMSMSQPEFAFSISVLAQADNTTRISTSTNLKASSGDMIRGESFSVRGTVLTNSDEPADNMTVYVLMTRSQSSECVVVGKGSSEDGNFLIECTAPIYMDVGEYLLAPVSLGSTNYAPSTSEYGIILRATTRIEFGSEQDFSLGYGMIHGHLSLDNKTNLVNTPVLIEVTSLAVPSKIWKLQNLTLRDGSFRIRTTFDNPGLYNISATFSGNEYMVGSNASLVANLQLALPAIQISSENIAIRGEVFEIVGTIQFRNVGIWGEPVILAFDDQLLNIVETKDNGSYTWSFPIGYDTELGSHSITVAIKSGNLSDVHDFLVKSKTKLDASASNTAGGIFILFSASLSDDQNMPIKGARVTLNDYGLPLETDENGNLTLFLDNTRSWSESSRLTVSFQGSEFYLPVTMDEEISPELPISLLLLVPLVCPPAVAVFLAYSTHLVDKRRRALQNNAARSMEDLLSVKEQNTSEMQETQLLRIVLPDINASFPNIWGVNEKLRIQIVPNSGTLLKKEKPMLEVLADQEPVGTAGLVERKRVDLSHVFTKKGEHVIRAILDRNGQKPWNTEIKLLSVDYREEVIRLYGEFLEKLRNYEIGARKEMTAREIENLVTNLRVSKSQVLRRVTTCFEKAEYSNHSTVRRDYETMYLSLRELHIDTR